MTTSLHERITLAIRNNLSPRVWAEADDIADVVLSTLDMHEEHGRLKVTRYVTSWYIDDDSGESTDSGCAK